MNPTESPPSRLEELKTTARFKGLVVKTNGRIITVFKNGVFCFKGTIEEVENFVGTHNE